MLKGSAHIAHQPTVSIITVVKNAAHLLPGFFESVSDYVSPDVELVLLDGASTDGTVDVLKQYDHLIARRHSEPDNGIYDAMNKAVKLARGKWLYFMGVDDRLLGGFSKTLPKLQQANTIYHAKVVVWGEVWGKSVTGYGLTKTDICHQSVFYPRVVFDRYRYDPQYIVYADQHLNLRCYADKRFKWEFVDELIGIYDTRGFSAGLTDSNYQRDYPFIVKKNLGIIPYLRYRVRKYKQLKKANKD